MSDLQAVGTTWRGVRTRNARHRPSPASPSPRRGDQLPARRTSTGTVSIILTGMPDLAPIPPALEATLPPAPDCIPG